MKKIIKVLIVLYILIAISTTISLFTYNEYNISEVGDKVIIKLNKELASYKKGNLIIINKKDKYETGDNVFFCKIKEEKCNIDYGKIITTMGGNPKINNEEVTRKLILGYDKNIKVIPILGSIMAILESRWIYFFFIVLPILVAFIYEIYTLSKELKNKNIR